MAIELDKKSFDNEILNKKGVALVDFWASWCGPCQKQVPIVNELAKEIRNKAIVAKVNVEEQQDLANEYRISSIPTLMVFKDGKVVDKLLGLHSKEQLTSAIQKHL